MTPYLTLHASATENFASASHLRSPRHKEQSPTLEVATP
jgi:hypothetical protein